MIGSLQSLGDGPSGRGRTNLFTRRDQREAKGKSMCSSHLLKRCLRESDGGARQCRDQPTSRIPPLLSHKAGYFAAAAIFAPVRTLVRAMTRDISRQYSACSPPYPLSFLVFSTGPEVREDSCITDHRCANHLINLWCSARIISSSLGLDGCRVQD